MARGIVIEHEGIQVDADQGIVKIEKDIVLI